MDYSQSPSLTIDAIKELLLTKGLEARKEVARREKLPVASEPGAATRYGQVIAEVQACMMDERFLLSSNIPKEWVAVTLITLESVFDRILAGEILGGDWDVPDLQTSAAVETDKKCRWEIARFLEKLDELARKRRK